MKYLPEPALPDAFHALSKLRTLRPDDERRGTLENVVALLPALASAYRRNMRGHRVMTASPLDEVARAHMKHLYKELRRANGLNSLQTTSLLDPRGQTMRCVYCEISKGKQLDHFLPQDAHPEFALETINLIPCCSDCNGRKSTLTVTVDGRRFPHAYLDPEVQTKYLYAQVRRTNGIVAVSYELRFHVSVTQVERENIELMYQRLDLLATYDSEGLRELEEVSDSLQLLDELGYLSDWSETQAAQFARQQGTNHWKTALYSELAMQAS